MKPFFYFLYCLSIPQILFAQYTYEGPTRPVPNESQLIKVEVLIRDNPELNGDRIQTVIFNGTTIPLKPPDLFGNRGSASFQLMPGKYPLRWVVQKDKVTWPRTISHEEIVTINPRDSWIQILIEGEEASVR